MSSVTNLIVLPGLMEDTDSVPDWLQFVHRYLEEWSNAARLVKVDHLCSGRKNMDADVYIAAFNYFGANSIHQMLNAAPWIRPDEVQYLIRDQDDDGWTLFRIGELGADAARAQQGGQR